MQLAAHGGDPAASALVDRPAIAPLPAVAGSPPDLRVALPGGEQARLPGLVWPALASRQPRRQRRGQPGSPKPIVDVVEIDIGQADRLLADFRHPLPPASRRRYGRMSFTLRAHGVPVAVCVSASTHSRSVDQEHGLHRYNTVELARIGRRDPPRWPRYGCGAHIWRRCSPNATPTPGWGRHRLRAAITYSLPGTPASAPDGDGIYRRDGWTRLRRRKLSRPGPNAGWSQPSAAAPLADGVAGLWIYWYEPPTGPCAC